MCSSRAFIAIVCCDANKKSIFTLKYWNEDFWHFYQTFQIVGTRTRYEQFSISQKKKKQQLSAYFMISRIGGSETPMDRATTFNEISFMEYILNHGCPTFFWWAKLFREKNVPGKAPQFFTIAKMSTKSDLSHFHKAVANEISRVALEPIVTIRWAYGRRSDR